MNEQAIKDAYNLFVQSGYNKSINDFKQLIATNPQALNDSYKLFVNTGYNKDIESFKSLMGLSQQAVEPVKKKVSTDSGLVSGSLELPKNPIDSGVAPMAESTVTAPKDSRIGVTGKPMGEGKIGTPLNIIGGFNQSVYKNFLGTPVKAIGTALQGITAKITGGDGRGFISDALIKFGDSYNKAIEELNPQDEEFKGTITDQFAQAFGQVSALILTGGATGGAKAAAAAGALQTAPKAVTLGSAAKQLVSGMATPTGASAALSMGQSEFDRAKEAGATDEQAFEAFYKNAVTGSILETLPVMQFLNRFNKATAGGITNYLKTKAIGGLTGGVEEMTTEVLQQLYANKTAQEIYNVNQDLFEGVGESGGVGFGVGFLLNAMGAQAKILRKQGKEQEADVIDAQVESFQQGVDKAEMPPPPPAVYKMKGVPFVTKEAIEEIVMNAPIPEIMNLGIEIENDQELSNKLQERVIEHSIKEQVRQANPNLDEESLSQVVTLEKELQSLQGNTTQSGKDKAASIRSQIKAIQENAVQKQTTNEGVLRTEQSEMGLQEVGQGDQVPEVATEEGQQEEVAAIPEDLEEKGIQVESTLDAERLRSNGSRIFAFPEQDEAPVEVTSIDMLRSYTADQLLAYPAEVSSKTQAEQRINIAPFFNTTVASREEAKALRQGSEYKAFVQTLQDIAKTIGVKANILEGIGGYRNDAGEEIVEISNVVSLEGADIEKAEEFAALAAALAPEVQEASIAAQYVEESSEKHNANEYVISVSDVDGALDALKEAGIKEFSVNEDTGTVSFIDVLDFADPELQDKIGKFIEVLNQKNISYEQSEFRPVESRYVDKGTRKEVLRRIKEKGANLGQGGQQLLQATEQAIQRDAEFQGVTYEEYLRVAEDTTEALLDLDTKEQTNLDKVLSFLDRIDNDLDKFSKETAGINLAVPVIRAIVKAVKALVKTGITLQEAIRRAAKDNNVSEEDVVEALNHVAAQAAAESKAEGTSEVELPGYNRVISEVTGVIEKTFERGNDIAKAEENAIAYLQGTKVYEDATDLQREQLIRDVREILELRQKSAPSAAKLLGQEKTTLTVDEMASLKAQLRLEARAARDAKNDMNARRKALADAVRKMASNGLLTAKKAATLLNKISKVNLYNNEMVERFIDYAGKVFADAEYGAKLTVGNALRKRLRKLSKNTDKSANLRALARKFVEIDPSMVENIDEYNELASVITESIVGSKIRGAEVKLANVVREDAAMEYIDKALAEQQQKLYEMKIAEIQELLGVDATGLKYEDLLEILSTDKKPSKDNEALVRATIQKAFNIYSAAIDEMLRSGKDLFTGEDIDFTDNQRQTIKNFMEIDLNLMSPKDALTAVDALLNFIQNGSTARMETVYRKNKAEVNIMELSKQGVKASPLRKYYSERLGRLLTEQLANLNVLFERMFKGFSRGGMVENLSGITDLKNGKAKAQTMANRIVDLYVEKFFGLKPNDQDFNTAFNAVERGMAAFMGRTVIGTEREMQAEFDRRKGLVEQSISALMSGNKKEIEKGKVYQQVYDKLLKDAANYEDVIANVDQANQDAIDFWRQQWADKFDDLSNVSLNVYNKVLDKDFNYVPDRFVNLSSNTGKIDLTADEMAFHINNGTMYKKSTGVLMEATRPEELPRNENNDEPGMFIDLSFDKANANAMYDALVDINTAGAIRQVDAFIKSQRLRTIIPSPEDIRVLQRRVNLFVNNIRNKNPYTEDELSQGIRSMNRIAAFGVSQALGGVLQPLKQVMPVAMNTLINAKGIDVSSIFDKAKNDFITNSGYSIANRGIESQAQIDSLNKLIDEAANGKAEKIFKALEKVNGFYLKAFLVKPDVFIARASWMTYYEQSLVEQGIDPETIDYETHEINDTAADYAQRMVDRQQNVSDSDLAGKLLSEKDAMKQLVVKMLMPFASFRMNQSARLGADIATVMAKDATVEDKKLAMRSLAGFGVEMATFRLLSTGISILIASAVKSYMDREDDEEKEKKKLESIIKGQATNTVNDLLSPAPFLDKMVQMAFGNALDSIQDLMNVAEDDRISIYTESQQTFVQSLGLFGISADRALQLWELISLSAGGSFEDRYGREKYISEKDREALKPLIAAGVLINFGLAPTELNSFTRSAVADAKRNSSTKEGGESSAEQAQEKEADKLREERVSDKTTTREQKVKAIQMLKQEVGDEAVQKELNKMSNELGMSEEERKASKQERAQEKMDREEKLKKLLKGYDNKSEMKRYDPDLYEQTFGEGSEYYRENRAKIEAEKALRNKLQEIEDRERGYSPIQKQKSRLRLRRE